MKAGRRELVHKVVKLANLPEGKTTLGYLTRGQLADLVLWIQEARERIRRAKVSEVDNAKG